MKVFCPQCGQRAASDGIDIVGMSARCSMCHVVIGLGELLDKDTLRTGDALIPVGNEVLPPKSKRIRHRVDDRGVEIVFRWYLHIFWVFLAFGIGWNTIMVRILINAATKGTLPFAVMSTSLHTLAGIFVVVFAILGLLNRTTIRISGQVLSVHVGPLRVRLWRRLDVVEIEQLYCRKKEGTIWSLFGGYALIAIRAHDSPLCVVDGFAEADELRYIERALEIHLGIPDRRVEGEFVAGIANAGVADQQN
jgi:hypothetical protein